MRPQAAYYNRRMGHPPGSDVDGASQADAPASTRPRGQDVIEFAPPETADLPAGIFVGEYQIDHKLGEGGMASVYAGVHPVIGKRAAVKVMNATLSTDATAVARFVQEARSVNQIGHPNIVYVLSFHRLPDWPCCFVLD